MRLFVTTSALLLLCGCSGMAMEYSPIRRDDGSKGYTVRTVYGPLNGDKVGASAKLDKEAKRLCPSGYSLVGEEEHPRQMKIGSRPNGEIDLVWEIGCKA